MSGPTKFEIGSRWELRAEEVARRRREGMCHPNMVITVSANARFVDPGTHKLCTFEVPGHPPGKCAIACSNGLLATLSHGYLDSIAVLAGEASPVGVAA